MKTHPFRFLALWILSASIALHAAMPVGTLSIKERAQGYREHRILAKPRAAFRAAADDAEPREGLRIHRTFPRLGHLRVIDLDASDSADNAIARLQATGRYEYVERDQILKPFVTPTDPRFADQWGLNNTGQLSGVVGADIRALTAWDTLHDAPNVVVAIVDSGIRLTHQDLVANLWASGSNHGIDATVDKLASGYYTPTDQLGHGTHVAGIIGAAGNNGLGISGVTWKTQLMALKFLVNEDGGTLSDEIECIQYAINNQAKVINASFGSSSYSQSGYDTMKAARDADIIVVAAAGNGTDNDGIASNNDTNSEYPANYALDNIVSVAAITRKDVLATFSNYGAGSVELAAPGSEIISSWFTSDSDYAQANGTSMAAPHVTGAVALLRAKYPTENYRQIINRLLRSVTKTSALDGKVQTGGRLNLATAMGSTTETRPFNDNFAERAALSGPNVVVRSNNVGATFETLLGELPHAGVAGGKSLWWSWTAPDTTQVAFDTTGTAYTASLAVYTGTTLGSLASVGSTTSGRLLLNVTGGTTYQIAVDGNAGATGYTTLRIGAVPTNDNFTGAKTITGTSASISTNLMNASKESGEPDPTLLAAGNSIWYKWTAPSSGHFILSAFATTIDTIAAVYTGSSVSSLTRIAYNSNSSSSNSDALVPFDANAGTTYYFQIDHSTRDGTGGGDVTIAFTEAAWEFPADDEITSSPAVGSDGTIYFGAGSAKGLDDKVYAVTSAGVRKWTATTSGNGVIGASPAVGSDGTLYIGTDDKILYALNSANGSSKWTFTAGSAISSTPAIAADGTIYFRDNTTLYALKDNGTSYTQKWSVAIPGSTTDGTYCSPVISLDGTIYVGSNGGKFSAISAAGTVRWTFTADGDIYTSPALAGDGTIYIATLNGTVYALTDTTIAVTQKWSWTASGNSSITSSIALGGDGSLYFAAYDHKLYALSSSGSQKWAYSLGNEVRAASPAVAADGTIYIPCYDGLIYAVSSTGALQRTYATARTIRSSPAIASSRLYVGSADGKLYAFDLGQNAASSAWPMFHFNAARTGRASSSIITISVQPQSRTVVSGTSVTLSVSATSGSALSYQWYKDGTAIGGATSSSYTVVASESTAGTYTVNITNDAGTLTSSPAVLSVVAAGTSGSTLANISTRAYCSTGNNVTIGGFVISGTLPKRVLVRAVGGPTLIAQGLNAADVLADPTIEVYQGQTLIATNDNWGDNANASEITTLGQSLGAGALTAGDTKSSAIILSLAPAPYTFIVKGKNDTSGIVLLEVYDADVGVGSKFANIASRAYCTTGDRVAIGGFVITGSISKRILVRAIGPTLTTYGLAASEVLADPTIELHKGAPVIGTNDNFGTNPNADEIVTTGSRIGAGAIATIDTKSAAMLVDLQPGAYTFIANGVGSASGIVLVEVYDAD